MLSVRFKLFITTLKRASAALAYIGQTIHLYLAPNPLPFTPLNYTYKRSISVDNQPLPVLNYCPAYLLTNS